MTCTIYILITNIGMMYEYKASTISSCMYDSVIGEMSYKSNDDDSGD